MVRLVWACCAGGRKHLGWVGTVSKLGTYQGSPCYCGYKTYGVHAWINIGTDGVVPVSWLIKIDPPEQPETVEHQEEITA